VTELPTLARLRRPPASRCDAGQLAIIADRLQELYIASLQGAELIDHLLSASPDRANQVRTLRRLRRAAAALERPL
jgi:hypothetical protein